MSDEDFNEIQQSALSAGARVDQISDEFERQWRAGESPRIEDFLSQVPRQERHLLLKELATIEIELRGKAGDRLDAREHRERFASDLATIDSVIESIQRRDALDPSLYSTVLPTTDEPS